MSSDDEPTNGRAPKQKKRSDGRLPLGEFMHKAEGGGITVAVKANITSISYDPSNGAEKRALNQLMEGLLVDASQSLGRVVQAILLCVATGDIKAADALEKNFAEACALISRGNGAVITRIQKGDKALPEKPMIQVPTVEQTKAVLTEEFPPKVRPNLRVLRPE